jgi:hypothetical protein
MTSQVAQTLVADEAEHPRLHYKRYSGGDKGAQERWIRVLRWYRAV